MSRFIQGMRLIFHKPDPIKQAAAEESARVRALKAQITTLEEILNSQAIQIKGLSSQLNVQQQGNMQEKIVNGIFGMFAPSSEPKTNLTQTQTQTQTTLESGRKYSDTELNGILSNIPDSIKNQLKELAFTEFKAVVKQQIPDMSEESLQRGHDLIKVQNG